MRNLVIVASMTALASLAGVALADDGGRDGWPWLTTGRALDMGSDEMTAKQLAAWLSGIGEAERAAGRVCAPNESEMFDTAVKALSEAPQDVPGAAIAVFALRKRYPCPESGR